MIPSRSDASCRAAWARAPAGSRGGLLFCCVGLGPPPKHHRRRSQRESAARYEKQATTARTRSGPKPPENSSKSIPAPRTTAVILSAIMFEIPTSNGERLWPARFRDFVRWQNGFARAWHGIPGEARTDHIKLATHRRRLVRAGEGKLGASKKLRRRARNAVSRRRLCLGP